MGNKDKNKGKVSWKEQKIKVDSPRPPRKPMTATKENWPETAAQCFVHPTSSAIQACRTAIDDWIIIIPSLANGALRQQRVDRRISC